VFNIYLITILTICVITDLKNRKIYNKVIFPGLLIAFASHMLLGGFQDLLSSLIGFVVGFVVLFIPYLMGGIGAGDVKLLALIGALMGSSFVLYTSIYMALAGGFIALVLLVKEKKFWAFLKSLPYILCGSRFGVKISVTEEGSLLSSTIPYGVAIAVGAILALTLDGRIVLW